MWRASWLAGGVLAALLLGAAGEARGQDDPTGGYDVDAVLHRQPHDIAELPSKEAARGRAITFELSLGGTYTTNAGTSRFDAIDTGYVTPGITLGVTPVTVAGWDVGGGALIDADYFAGDYDDLFGEGELEAFVFAERDVGPGTLTAELILLGVFDNDFASQQFRLLISDLTYSISRWGLRGDFSAEYQDSDVPELRRTRLATRVGYALPEPQLGYEITVEGDVIFSDFNGGANSSRNDVTAALVLIAERELGSGWSLGWEAAVVNRLSNRKSARFTTLDLGIALAKRF